jgi:hypothetical protein
MTAAQHHNDASHAGAPAPDWAGTAYDPPPVETYRFTGPATARTGFGYPPHFPTGMPRPPIGLAVVSALLFPPLGVWALVLAGQVTARAATGDTVGAMTTAGKARTVGVAGIAIGGLIAVLLCAGACSAMNDPYYYY